MMTGDNAKPMRAAVIHRFNKIKNMEEEVKELRREINLLVGEIAAHMGVEKKEARMVYRAWKDRIMWEEETAIVQNWLDILFSGLPGEDEKQTDG